MRTNRVLCPGIDTIYSISKTTSIFPWVAISDDICWTLMIFDEHLTGSNSLSPMSYLVADISELSSRQKPQAKIKTIFRKAAEQNFRSFPPPKLWLIFELWSLNWVKQSCHQRLLNGVNQARLFEPGYVWSVPSKRFIKVLKIFDYDVQSLAMWAQGKPSKNTDVFYIFSEIFFSKEQSTINGLEVMFLSNYLTP